MLKNRFYFVACIRQNLRLYPIDEAVENAVNYCIRNNILADFLKKNKAVVMKATVLSNSSDSTKHLLLGDVQPHKFCE